MSSLHVPKVFSPWSRSGQTARGRGASPAQSVPRAQPSTAARTRGQADSISRDASLGKGERRSKADLQDRKDDAAGRRKMVGKRVKELRCRRKEDGVLGSEQIRSEKMVAHSRRHERGRTGM